MATVLVDGENVRRSAWPNVDGEQLEELCARWARKHDHEVVVVWESRESADDRIVREARVIDGPVWVVTSDCALRNRLRPSVEHFVGGGTFLRELADQRP